MDELLSTQLQRQMVERTEDAILRILTGQRCGACHEPARHIEFGPAQFDFREQDLSAAISRTVRYFCGKHWPHEAGVVVADLL